MYYLTDEQLRVLARMEGMTVPEVLAKYDRIRPMSARRRSAAAKGGGSRKAVANPSYPLSAGQTIKVGSRTYTVVRILPTAIIVSVNSGDGPEMYRVEETTKAGLVRSLGERFGVRSNPKRPTIKYTGDWYDIAKAYGLQIPDEDSPGHYRAVLKLTEFLENNKGTIYPEIAAWVDKLVVEDQGEEPLFRSLQQKLRTNGPSGVSAVAQNIQRLWV
jgi:hypothetical protein